MLQDIINKQHDFFNNSETIDISYRINALLKLKSSIFAEKENLITAFKKDFNKCEYDVLSTEVGFVVREIEYLIKNLNKISKPKKVKTSILNYPSSAKIVQEPFGTCLIVSPWNYPFYLSFMPLIGAISVGNTVILKLSSKAPEVRNVIKIILSVFNEEYIYVSQVNQNVFDYKYDFIFYTGSSRIAKLLQEKQAQNITPIILELGGKSPCIVDETASLDVTAKRIVWGKFLNAGQTCIAPDYLLVKDSVKNQLISLMIYYIKHFYYDNTGKLSNDFPYVIDDISVSRLKKYTEHANIVFGGNVQGRCFEPTIIDNVKNTDAIMKDEIFGPILPVISFNNIDEVLKILKTKEKPLALYYFGRDNKIQKYIDSNLSFGGGCYNDCIMHITESKLPFGGVGQSGYGAIHGNKTFFAFSHAKSILKKSSLIDIDTKYPPYFENKTNFLKEFFGLKK